MTGLPDIESLTPKVFLKLPPEERGQVVAAYLLEQQASGIPVAPQLLALIESKHYQQIGTKLSEFMVEDQKTSAEQMILSRTPDAFQGLNSDEREAYILNVHQLMSGLGVFG